jgi:hypothetical protein
VAVGSQQTLLVRHAVTLVLHIIDKAAAVVGQDSQPHMYFLPSSLQALNLQTAAGIVVLTILTVIVFTPWSLLVNPTHSEITNLDLIPTRRVVVV